MKTYVINLAGSVARLAFMREQLEKADLPFERFDAVNGKALAPEDLRKCFSRVRSLVAMKKRMSLAEIGVALSHVGCYRKMLASGDDMAVILEDDVVLAPDFPAALKRVAKFVDSSKPQIVSFSGYGVPHAEALPEEIRPEASMWCADAYCITRAGAELLVRLNDPVVTVADAFKRWHRRYGLELYRALPATARQDDATFPSANQVLPKANWVLRNVLWILDWLLCKMGC